MAITARQKEQRQHHLGSSDVATLFGLNPFQSEYDVWLEKTGQLEPDETVKPWLEAGNDFEPIILNKASRVLGKLQRSQYRSAKKLGLPLGANVDALAVDRGKRPVEAKAVGLFWPVDEAWGQEGTSEVPDRVNIQCHVHMITTDQDLCYVPSLQWGLKFAMYEVPRDEGIVSLIKARIAEWWDRHIVEGKAPEGSSPSIEVIKRVKRVPDKMVEIPAELVQRWRRYVTAEGKVRKLKEVAQADVIKVLGDAEYGTCELGTVSYLLHQQAGYTVLPKSYRSTNFKPAKKSA